MSRNFTDAHFQMVTSVTLRDPVSIVCQVRTVGGIYGDADAQEAEYKYEESSPYLHVTLSTKKLSNLKIFKTFLDLIIKVIIFD